jgi:GT2 family glycosyltransferase
VSSPRPILSVIIVAYQSRDELPGCLTALPRALHGRPVEVCVVNNSAGDGGAVTAQRDFPWVQWIEPGPNLGFGRANNLGFGATTGECVLFLNPDTVCSAPALEHCLGRVLAEPEIGLISPRLELPDGSMDLACRRSIPTLWDGFCRATGLAAAFPRTALVAGYNLTHRPADETYAVGAINGAFMLGRRSFLESIAAPAPPAVFDEGFFMYGDDLDLCIRVARAGARIIYDGRVRIIHLKGQSVAKEYAAMAEAIFDANREVFLKHFNPRGSALVRWKYTLAFGAWKRVALLRARWRGQRRVRPM